MKCVLFASRTTFLNCHSFLDSFLWDLFTLAHFASFFHVDYFTLSTAFITRTCALRIHSWSHLSHDGSYTSTFTSCTFYNCGFICSTDTIAWFAYYLSLNVDFNVFTIVDISQTDFDTLGLWLDSNFLFLSSATSAAAHEHWENIIHPPSTSTTFETFHTMFVICVPLVFIVQNLVCSLNFFELLFNENIFSLNIWLNVLTFSGSPPLSGWSLIANLR